VRHRAANSPSARLSRILLPAPAPLSVQSSAPLLLCAGVAGDWSREFVVVAHEVVAPWLATTELLRDYLAAHPRRDDPAAPLFCSVTLKPSKPTGKRGTDADGKRITPTAVDALAGLSVDDAAERLVLDWSAPIRHQTFYKAVFRPSVLRANRLGGDGNVLPPALKFHALRHTYASLCVAAGIPPLQLSRFMGHAKVTTTLSIYTHLFDDDHAETMAALSLRRTWCGCGAAVRVRSHVSGWVDDAVDPSFPLSAYGVCDLSQ
jgi:hypothetical protein